MGILETRDLGEAGLAYVRDYLAGVNVFCSELYETVITEPGEVFTVAPAGTTEDRLREFNCGGLLSENLERTRGVTFPDGSMLVPVTSLIGHQVTLLLDLMRAVSGAICILDDFNPSWSKQGSELGPTAFGVGEEVYHLIRPSKMKRSLSRS